MRPLALLLLAVGCSAPPPPPVNSPPRPGQAVALAMAAEVFGAPAGWTPPPIEWVDQAGLDCIIDDQDRDVQVPPGQGSGMWVPLASTTGKPMCVHGGYEPVSRQVRLVWWGPTVAGTSILHELAHDLCGSDHGHPCFAALPAAELRLIATLETKGETQ